MQTPNHADLSVCLRLTQAISRTRTVDEIYGAAFDALCQGLGVSRASILLFDPDGVMRFKASCGLSEAYRSALDGHSPWRPDSPDPEPIVVSDVAREPSLAAHLPAIEAEGIGAMALFPLVSRGRVVGKIMLYYDTPHELTSSEQQMAGVVAAVLAFAVERTSAEDQARQSEEQLRFALDAATMGTWEWDLFTGAIRWSENLERLHGLAPGTFDGTFESYRREIHPDDCSRVLLSVQRAVEEGAPHDVEYRIVAPDGAVRWVEGKGRVDYVGTRPVRMTGVCLDVTRRKEAELARLESAHEASRLKDEFLAVLSHELRTPLNAIMGWTQLLESNALPPERITQAIGIISRNARLQAQLIDDVLDVSRIITGKLDIERTPVSFGPLIEAALGAVRPSARAAGIDVTCAIPDDLPPVEGDAQRLQQVLGNLLANAVKFTPEGGSVRLMCSAGSGTVRVEVQDSGIGIAPEFLPHVFDRFRQADSRSTRRHGGLGLGLAIARHLVECHGGTIRAASDGLNRGATFIVELPVAAAVRDAPAAAGGGPAERDGRLRGIRVLVVDDESDSRHLLNTLLAQHGASVIDADSAPAALASLSTHAIDLVVADIAMPDVDGYELIRRLRLTRPVLPAIALSAYARPEDRTEAIEAGYDAYFTKPFDAGELIASLTSVLALRSEPASASNSQLPTPDSQGSGHRP